MLGEAEMAAAKKLSENEARVTELTDRWKDRWKETQKILEVWTITGCIILIIVIDNKSSYSKTFEYIAGGVHCQYLN